MSKIKVLQMPIYEMGGINQYILKNWEFVDRDKFQFDFATLSKRPLDFEQKLKGEGCKVHYISCYAEDDRERFIAELNKIFDEGYDVVHLHTSFWRGFLMEEVAVARNIPVIIVHAHSNMIDIADASKREMAIKEHKRLKPLFSPSLATHFCACSNAAGDWLFGEQIKRDDIRVLNNAIDTNEFSYKPLIREKVRKELGIENSFVIGHAGRFSYQKNHEMLVDVFSEVSKRVSNAKLLLIGDGELQEQICKKSSDYGISERVMFLGKRGDVPDLMQAMDVFALPSRFEGLGIVLIEAQCAGLPCLASEFVPIETKITSNLEFLPYDITAWSSRIIEIAESGYTRKDMSGEVAKAGYSLKEQIKILEKIYNNNA